jgi:hypothetical protein
MAIVKNNENGNSDQLMHKGTPTEFTESAIRATQRIRPPVKYFSTQKSGYSILLQEKDENGKPIWEINGEGDKTVKRTKLFKFANMPGKDPVTGKISAKYRYTMCLVDATIFGEKWYDLIIEHLEKARRNPDNKLFLEPDFIAATNPVASIYEKKNRELEAQLSEKDKRIAELERKMGGNFIKS